MTLSEKLQNIGAIFRDEGNDPLIQTISIRRRKVWHDSVQKLGRLFSNGVKPFSVSFVGEAGVDAVGPKREFFTLLFEDSRKHLLTTGNGSSFTLLHDVEKIRQGEFRLLGTMIAIALASECAGPKCFTPALTSKLLNGPEILPKMEEIPDIEVQEKLKDLLAAASDKDFQMLLEKFDERFLFGVTKAKVEFSERDALVRDISKHFCVSVCSEEIHEVRKGMELLGILAILEEHFEESKNEFLLSVKQSASIIQSLFTNVAYTKATDNTDDCKKRELEEDIFYHFTNFLEGLQYDAPVELPLLLLEEDGTVQETTTVITLEEVAMFLTGSKYITPALKGKGSILFDHCGLHGTVTVNTCNICLTFPVLEKYYRSTESFNKSFLEDIRSDSGFGNI